MKIPPLRHLQASKAFQCLAAFCAIGAVVAQESGINDEAVFLLSPFIVDVSSDDGYRAANSLAGSRLNTPLTDIASSIDVLNEEFLSDLAATNEGEIMSYFSGADRELSDQTEAVQGINLANNTNMQYRVRGQSASRTINLFESSIRGDAYNIGRADLASGPNSILFGMGGAGGILNTSTKQASTNRSYGGVSVRTFAGEFSGFRSTIDYNFALSKKFAIRVNLLDQDDNGYRPHEFYNSDRAHVVAVYRIHDKITLRGEYEKSKVRNVIARDFAPVDGVLKWIANGRTPAPAFNTNNPNAGIKVRNANQRLTYVSNDNTWYNMQQSAFSAGIGDGIGPNGQVLLDPELAPLDAFYPGPGSFVNADQKTMTGYLELRPLDDLFIEFGYNHEEVDHNGYDPTHANYQIIAEPTSAFRDGTKHNYQGSLYVDSRWVKRQVVEEADRFRATASYSLDLERWGRHNFAAMYSVNSEEFSPEDQFLSIGTAFNPNPTNARNQVFTRQYVDLNNLSTRAQPSWQGLVGVPMTVKLNSNSEPTTYTPEWWASNISITDTTIKSYLASMQSYWWNERLITTLGWRKTSRDGDKITGTVNPQTRERVFNSDPDSSDSVSEDGISAQGVFVITHWFRLLYNFSENFNIPGSRSTVIPTENLRTVETGEGQDVGFMLDLFNRKLFIRATYFNATAKDVGAAFGVDTNLVARNIRILDAAATAGEIAASEAQSLKDNLRGSSWDVLDRESTGYELRINANPTKNWTLMANASWTDVKDSNVLKLTKRFAPPYLERWSSFSPGLNTETTTIAGEIDDYNKWFDQGIAAENFNNLNSPDFKANTVIRYNFSDGFLKGTFLGTGLSYRSAPVINVNRTLVDGVVDGTVWKGKSRTEAEAFIGYNTQVRWFGTQKNRLSFQLNAKNLIQNDDIIPIRINNNGNLYRAVVVPPVQISFTAKLQF